MRRSLLLALFSSTACMASSPITNDPGQGAPHAAVASPAPSAAVAVPDYMRQPAETLSFFGLKASDTVVDIWPGDSWRCRYAEIIAPYVARGGGAYIAAVPDNRLSGVQKLIAENPDYYGQIRTANFPVLAAGGTPVAPGSADIVITYLNVHNWIGNAPYEAEAFRQIYVMLKPGGTLGVVEHRQPEGADDARQPESGYVKVSTVRRLAEAAGFRLVGSSEVNANLKDATDHPEGVWTVPPTYRLSDTGCAPYAAIGESDRMTLKFIKPR